MSWAYPGPKPTATRVLDWVKEHRPSEPNVPVLLWGDARIGNMIFAPGGTPVAVLDWETATFGQAEEDLNTQVGPFGVEVLEGLKRLRVVLGPNDHGLAFDLAWEGSIPPQVEPQHLIRSQERVVFDSKRMAQTGQWTGSITVDGETLDVTPDRWWGIRDRSWGIRPVGEPEPPGIQARNAGTFYWLYAPVRFTDHAILCIVQEDYDGHTGYGLYEYWALGDHPSFR